MPYDSEELKNIKSAPLKKQLTFLKNFEDAIQQNKVKLDQQSDLDIEHLIDVCKFEHYNENMELEESFNEIESDSQGNKEHKESENDEDDQNQGVS